MTEQIPEDPTINGARRRLVRGTFAVPAALTVCTGSALAESSVTCLAKATATAGPTIGLFDAGTAGTPTSFPDSYTRVQLRRQTVDQTTYMLTRASLGAFQVSTSMWQSNVTWQRVGVTGQSNANNFKGTPKTTTVPAAQPSKYWVALRFDSAGKIVGVGASNAGSVVGSSCWTSLRASA